MAIKILAGIAKDGTSESARVSAATALLDRGWGRPRPDDGDGEQITIVIRRILEGTVAEAAPATNGATLEGEVLLPEKR
jgi:hypothetical protein